MVIEQRIRLLLVLLFALLVACEVERSPTPPVATSSAAAVATATTPGQIGPTTTVVVPLVDPTRAATTGSRSAFAPTVPADERETAVPLPTVTSSPEATPVTTFYVAADGSDDSGGGTEEEPWASVAYAVEQVPDGAAIVVAPGIYHGAVALERQFEEGIVIRSSEPYRARLEDDDTVVTCYRCAGIMLEGFEIAHDGEGADRYVIQIQDVEGDGEGGRRVTLHNNVIHDSRNNDLVKVNNGASEIMISGNIFYNMGGPHRDSHLDINSVTDVVVQDNIFFNDFAASNRDNDHDTGSFVVIKDSNEDDDANLGSQRITVRRNIFLNWQGDDGNTFLVVGEDSVDYFQATDVLIENNLMLGNAREDMLQAAFQVRGSREVLFRNNTVAGDLPAQAFALRLARADDNPRNEEIAFYNNIWSDPTGTMGAEESSAGLFADADPDDTESFMLENNLYWNGGEAIPLTERELVNYNDDVRAVIGDPELGEQEELVVPLWQRETGQFADGSRSVREAFERLVVAFGTPGPGSAALDAADAEHAASEDILGNSRPAGEKPDIGAVEVE